MLVCVVDLYVSSNKILLSFSFGMATVSYFVVGKVIPLFLFLRSLDFSATVRGLLVCESHDLPLPMCVRCYPGSFR